VVKFLQYKFHRLAALTPTCDSAQSLISSNILFLFILCGGTKLGRPENKGKEYEGTYCQHAVISNNVREAWDFIHIVGDSVLSFSSFFLLKIPPPQNNKEKI
jgi:hypothetical protein